MGEERGLNNKENHNHVCMYVPSSAKKKEARGIPTHKKRAIDFVVMIINDNHCPSNI
jgi:hypothetical protein